MKKSSRGKTNNRSASGASGKHLRFESLEDRRVLSTSATPAIVSDTLTGEFVFYNHSIWDGNNSAINANDDNAIATDKLPIIPAGVLSVTPTFANYTSYTKGINGIMLDVTGPGQHANITASDFQFTVGTDLSKWASFTAAPAPVSVVVRSGAGNSGADRVEIVWADNAIQNQWLAVTIPGSANINVASGGNPSFFFGNQIADSGLGNSSKFVVVDATDEIAVRNNHQVEASITSPFDYNRDGAVDNSDETAALGHQGVGLKLTALPPFVVVLTAGTNASAAASPAASAIPGASNPLSAALIGQIAHGNLNSGSLAQTFQTWAQQNTPKSRALLVAAEQLAAQLGLDHHLLSQLLTKLKT